jgi:hypothetical protein
MLLAFATALFATLSVRSAQACGGFFCSQTPVDQTAERIIFTVNADSTITAYVQISYTGQRDAFAWVVPVSSIPTVDTFPRTAFQALDLATQPTYVPPPGCFPPILVNGGGSVKSQSDVTVYGQAAVGPYQSAIIGGTNSASLVDWLRTNGYFITDAMVPFIEPYVRQKMFFLALRLLPDKDVSDIEPVKMTYMGTEPMVPLQLTAVAARPQLGVLVFILAGQRFESTNYANLLVDDADLTFTVGSNNYTTLVSRMTHASSGHAFVTDLAGPVAPVLERVRNSPAPSSVPGAVEGRDALIALLQGFPYITRLYTRLSPEDMTVDPTFAPSVNAGDVSNAHDLSARRSDAGGCQPPPCAFTDCGSHGRCISITDDDAGGGIATSTRVDACECDDGYTAAALQTTFSIGAAVQCEPVTNNLMPNGGVPGSCSNDTCGTGGQCVSINGTPTCACAAGFAANSVGVFDGVAYVPVVRCIAETGPIPPPPDIPQRDAGVTGGQPIVDAGSPVADAGIAPVRATVGCGCAVIGESRGSWRAAALACSALGYVARRRRRSRGQEMTNPRRSPQLPA